MKQITRITDYLEQSAALYPDWDMCVEGERHISYRELRHTALCLAYLLIEKGYSKEPVMIYMDKSPNCIAAMFAVCYSGNYYTVLDTAMPAARIERIRKTLQPAAVITDAALFSDAGTLFADLTVINLDESFGTDVDEKAVLNRTAMVLDTDIQYVLFTSGSTGNPKGVVTTHRNVINYTEATSGVYRFNHDTVMCSQVPFYFVMSIVDIFGTIRNGGTLHIVPRMYYSFPVLLMEYIAANRINAVYWVPSALNMVANMGALDAADISSLKTVCFSGEVMPVKQLNMWMNALPHSRFINVYGPTEVTDGITYYEVNREFKDNQTLPIGSAFPNLEVLVINEKGEKAAPEETGELCVRGGQLTKGYYGDPARTKEVFVQVPFNTHYEEKMYRSGDLVYRNAYGEYEFAGRKDYQIKHMGNRIELGEIEANVSSLGGIEENACLYNAGKDHIVLYYAGSVHEGDVLERLIKLVPKYMLPNRIVRLSHMPHNLNGKIDRAQLKNRLQEDDK